MFNPEPNLAEWQESARELLNNPRLTRYLEHLDRGVKEYRASLPEGERPAEFYDHRANLLKFAEAALPIQDESMRGYAGHWAALSAHHDQTGVYKRCVDFFQHDQGKFKSHAIGPVVRIYVTVIREIFGVRRNIGISIHS